MCNVSTLDASIALGGYSGGLAIGCLHNIWKTGSLFRVPRDEPNEVSFVVKHLGVNRNVTAAKVMTNGGIVRIWSPLIPVEHLGPLATIIITQVFFAALSPEATVLTTASALATHTFKIIVVPLVLNYAVLFGGAALRYFFRNSTCLKNVNPSGHALSQCASAIYKLFIFSALVSSKLESTPYRAIAAVTSISDYLWTYRTASSYHSVMDMAVTTIYMGISFGAVYGALLIEPQLTNSLSTYMFSPVAA